VVSAANGNEAREMDATQGSSNFALALVKDKYYFLILCCVPRDVYVRSRSSIITSDANICQTSFALYKIN